MISRSHRLGVVFAALLGACVATPLPDPPDLGPPNVGEMTATPMNNLVGPASVRIVGNAGAARPGSTLHVVRLGTDLPPVLTIVVEDGSFDATFEAIVGDELRMSFRDGDARSEPIDVIVPEMDGVLVPVMREPCVTIDPPLSLDLGEAIGDELVGPITIENGCAGPITITPRLRARSSVIAVDAPIPAMVSPGELASVEARFTSSIEGRFEEIAFIDVTGAATASYPITIFAIAR